MTPVKRKIVITVSCVIAAVLLGMAALAFLLALRVDKLDAGMLVQAEFEAELISGEESKLFEALEELDFTSGRLTARSDGKRYSVKLMPEGAVMPFTEIDADSGDLLINVEMIYNYTKDRIAKDHPLLGKLLPNWNMGSCLSRNQLEELLEKEDLLPVPRLSLNWLVPAKYEDGLDGYTYFTFPTGDKDEDEEPERSIYIGVTLGTLLKKTTEAHIVIEDRGLGLRLQLTGDITAEEMDVPEPTKLFSDEDMDRLKDIWSTVKPLLVETESLVDKLLG